MGSAVLCTRPSWAAEPVVGCNGRRPRELASCTTFYVRLRISTNRLYETPAAAGAAFTTSMLSTPKVSRARASVGTTAMRAWRTWLA